jgi:hypothetical protein
MQRNDHPQVRPFGGERGARFKLAALVLTGVTIVTATGLLMSGLHPSASQDTPPPDQRSSAVSQHSQRQWPKPDVAIVFSGQQYGYVQPCGCSEPQKGGLARRYNFMNGLRQRDWPVIAADLGDIAQATGPQAIRKYKYSIQALKRLGYTAVGIGENEINLPLIDALAETALQDPSPRVVVANLKNKAQQFPNMVESCEVSDAKVGLSVGFVGAVGSTVAGQVQQGIGVDFDNVQQVLPAALKELEDKKAEFLVLLYQGTEKEARSIATKFPQFNIILWGNKQEPEEPSARPDQVGNTLLVSVGHKGRYVGLVGVYRTGKEGQPFQLRYELIEIGPSFETPEGQEKDNPIHALLQKYAEEVRDKNDLAKYPHDARHPVQVTFPKAEYVGSEACQDCHPHAYKIWLAHPHSRAYQTLENRAKRPSLRQYDGECIQCHVTGWSPGTIDTGPGFGYRTGFTNEKDTPHLKGVGCESCHGPASLHVQNKKNVKFREALNPLKAKPGQDPKVAANRIDAMCQKCHDQDNSVHFDFDEYWTKKKTVHPSPKKGAEAAAAPGGQDPDPDQP